MKLLGVWAVDIPHLGPDVATGRLLILTRLYA